VAEQNKLLSGIVNRWTIQSDYYYLKEVNDLLTNRPVPLVAKFKDYLIYDDVGEYLKAFHSIEKADKIFQKQL
jgi:hypothetical protein